MARAGRMSTDQGFRGRLLIKNSVEDIGVGALPHPYFFQRTHRFEFEHFKTHLDTLLRKVAEQIQIGFSAKRRENGERI